MFVPSPLAALVYIGVKVAGYSAAAVFLNRRLREDARPLRFGIAKTLIGFASGCIGLLIFGMVYGDQGSDATLFVFAAPFRLLAWAVALRWFYRLERRTFLQAVLAGALWSYALDLLMAGLYRVLPGMVIPWC